MTYGFGGDGRREICDEVEQVIFELRLMVMRHRAVVADELASLTTVHTDVEGGLLEADLAAGLYLAGPLEESEVACMEFSKSERGELIQVSYGGSLGALRALVSRLLGLQPHPLDACLAVDVQAV